MSEVETAPAAPRLLAVRERLKTIPLDWPVEYAGRTFREIVIRRLTAAEVSGFMAYMQAELKVDPDKRMRFPIFFDTDGQPVPDAVMDALDDDDQFALDEVADGFLPRRFRSNTEAQPSTPPIGAAIAPT